ncbi:MAG TPA: hypothetical protein VLA36_16290 [Longimicrobiales bacterium]|nr:hypothetical protein [Longimicrobiales bacterium]
MKSSAHCGPVDGESLTARDHEVFDPVNDRWIAENEGVPPDFELLMDARSVVVDRDPRVEEAVQEALFFLDVQGGMPRMAPPPYPTPSRRPRGGRWQP